MSENKKINFINELNFSFSDNAKIGIANDALTLLRVGGNFDLTNENYAEYTESFNATNIHTLSQIAVDTHDTAELSVKYFIKSNNIYYHYTQGVWVGTPLAPTTNTNANNLSTILNALPQLDIQDFTFRVFLQTNDANVTPTLSSLSISYENFTERQSESFDETMTVNEIIQESFEQLGVNAQQLSQGDYSRCRRLLNGIIRSWSHNGISIWNKKTYNLDLVSPSVVLGSDGFDYKCIKAHISNSNTEPIVGSQWYLYWKKLATQDADEHVINAKYIDGIKYLIPSEIIDIEKIEYVTSSTSYELEVVNKDHFLRQQYSEGTPNVAYFYNGIKKEISINPVNDEDGFLRIEAKTNTFNVDSGQDTVALDQSWNLALIFELATVLAPSRGVTQKTVAQLERKRLEYYSIVRASNTENTDLIFEIEVYD